jgi:hypothetical protein
MTVNSAGVGPAVGTKWLYFAYSFTLDPAFRSAFSRSAGLETPRFTGGTLAELKQHDLVYRAFRDSWNGRVAGFERGTESVYGEVYALDEDSQRWVLAAEKSIDAVPHEVPVMVAGIRKMAWAFVPRTAASDEGTLVSEAFVAHVLEGLATTAAPSPYIDKLFAEAAILETVQRTERLHAP